MISPKYASCALMTSSRQLARCTASRRVCHADSMTSNIRKADRLFTTCIMRPRIKVHLMCSEVVGGDEGMLKEKKRSREEEKA